jgi:uncharacterized protein (DUF433 family)
VIPSNGIAELRRRLDRPTYPAAEAARLVGIGATRVRRWLSGYEYTYADHRRRQRPVLRRVTTKGSSYASFLDLVDLLFVKRFLDHGISLQKLRRALNEASSILDSDHFARRTFFTDGRTVYLKVREQGDAILELLSGGQWVIAPIIEQLAEQIDFDDMTGLAERWYPLGSDGLIVVDPAISFGSPTLVGRGVPTANVFDLFMGEGQRTTAVSDWMGLHENEVLAAVAFEERMAR